MATMVPTLGSALLQATPILTAAPQILGALGVSPSAQRQEAEQKLALRQLQAQQSLREQQTAAETALERERLAAQGQSDEEARRAALRRAVSRQRASFGASGLGNQNTGSAQAVLLGLFDESEEELAQRERLDTLRNKALDLSLSNSGSLNVLQQTQLRERQNLQSQLSRTQSLFDSLF